LGVVLHEMVIGARPFDGESAARVIAAIVSDPVPSLSDTGRAIPDELDHIVRTALAKDRDNRWQSAADVAQQLRWLSRGGVSVADRRRPQSNVWRPILWSASVIGLCALVTWLIARAVRQESVPLSSVRIALLSPQNAELGRAVAMSP